MSSSSQALAIHARGPLATPWIELFPISCPSSSKRSIEADNAIFSPDGSRLATLQPSTSKLGSSSAHAHTLSLVIRDAAKGKAQLEIRNLAPGPVTWSADGILVAAAESTKDRVGVWDSRTGVRVGRVVSHIDAVTHIAFTTNNNVVTLSRDGSVRVTDPQASKTLAKLEVESTNPRLLSVASNGSRIVSVWGSTVHVWAPAVNQVTSYALASVRQVEGWPLAVSQDARYMALWTETGFDVAEVMTGQTVFSSEGGALVTAAKFDGNILMLGRMDGTAEFWEMRGKGQ